MRLTAGIGGAALIAMLALGLWSVFDSYRETRKEAGQNLQNLAAALERDIARDIELSDLALIDSINGLRIPGVMDASPELRQAALFSSINRASYVDSMAITDETGEVRFDSKPIAPGSLNLAARDYFQVQRDRADAGLFVSRPFIGILTQKPGIAFSRRISRSDGSFAGIARVNTRISFFEDLFKGLDLGAHGAVTLFRDDGALIARWPSVDPQLSRPFASIPAFKGIDASARSGLTEGRAMIDGVDRLYAFRRLDRLPLILSVGRSKDEVFAPWRRKAAQTMIALLSAVSLAVLLALALRREQARRTRLETRLRQQAADFKLLAENATDMISHVGTDGSRRYVSPAAAKIFGEPIEALRQADLFGRIVPEDAPAVMRSVRSLLNGETETETVLFRIMSRDRGPVWVQSRARAVRDPATGASDGYVSIIRDVTESLAAERALRASEAQFRVLAETTGDAIVCIDLHATRTYVSPAFQTLFGYGPDEVIGHSAADYVHALDVDEFKAQVEELAAGRVERSQATYRLRHKAGHFVWTEVTFGLKRDPASHQPAMIVCAKRDVTERKMHEDELEKANTELENLAANLAQAREAAERGTRAKSRFLASMSHELRTPLNGILGYTQLLALDTNLTETQSKRLNAMLGAGSHLLELIDCVLDLSQIESEQLTLNLEETDLAKILRACLDYVRPIAQSKGLAITLDLAPDTPLRLVTDPTRLRQILLNLLGNAVKFTAQGGVALRVGMGRNGQSIRIAVADTGPGIPEERRAELFRAFERLGVESQHVEGAGLGLALSAKLAALIGGQLSHANDPAGGSVFALELNQQHHATAIAAPAEVEFS